MKDCGDTKALRRHHQGKGHVSAYAKNDLGLERTKQHHGTKQTYGQSGTDPQLAESTLPRPAGNGKGAKGDGALLTDALFDFPPATDPLGAQLRIAAVQVFKNSEGGRRVSARATTGDHDTHGNTFASVCSDQDTG